MAKKRKVEKESRALAKVEGISLKLRDEADQKTYRKALDATTKIADDVREGLKKHSRSSMSMAWDIGNIWKSWFQNAKSQFGVITNATITAICSDLDPTEKGRMLTGLYFRYCLKLADKLHPGARPRVGRAGIHQQPLPGTAEAGESEGPRQVGGGRP